MQLDMPSGATVELPQKPLSLLPFEESSLYVRTVYYKLWSIITSHTGMCAADKCFETCTMQLTITFCNGSQSCSSASCLSALMSLHPADRILITGTPGVGKTSMLLFMLWKLAKTGCDIVLELFSMGPGRILIKG